MKRLVNITVLVIATVLFTMACQPGAVATPPPARQPADTAASATPPPTSTPTRTPTPTSTPTPTPTPPSTPTPPPATPSGADSVASVSGDPFEMILSETEVNELVREALASQANVPVTNPSVRLEAGQLVASGQVRLGIFSFDVDLVTVVPVRNGRPAPEIIDILVNGQPLGGLLRSQLVALIAPYLDMLAQAEFAIEFDRVQLTPGQIQILGRYK